MAKRAEGQSTRSDNPLNILRALVEKEPEPAMEKFLIGLEPRFPIRLEAQASEMLKRRSS
jgi:hypothetical protein